MITLEQQLTQKATPNETLNFSFTLIANNTRAGAVNYFNVLQMNLFNLLWISLTFYLQGTFQQNHRDKIAQ